MAPITRRLAASAEGATARGRVPGRIGRTALAGLVLLAAGMMGGPVAAEEDDGGMAEIFGELGTAEKVDPNAEPETPEGQRPGEGTVVGQVFDAESGLPIPGVSVVVTWPTPEDGSAPRIEVQVTDPNGAFELPSIPPGRYSVSFTKAGYRPSTMTNFEVVAGELNRADFPLPRLPVGPADEVLQLEAFVVEASTVDEMMASLELRMDADALLNIMSAEDLSKFAASDVADALTRVAGVNIVEGQFAIIRGLEDRYSSTLYNGAPIPSPDPDRQSVQLDLFPSEIVNNLIVTKTFEPDLPSNSSGGAIDIVTHGYPEELTLSLKGGGGFEENALDRFLGFQSGSAVGEEDDPWDVVESEYGASLGGRREILGREVRFLGLVNREVDYRTALGFQEDREPRQRNIGGENPPLTRPNVDQSGDLSLGELNLSGGRYDLTTSERSLQDTAYVGFGFDLDRDGNHAIDASYLYTKKDEETVQLKENGYLPEFDYAALAQDEADEGGEIDPRIDFLGFSTLDAFVGRGGVREQRFDFPSRGALYFTNFSQSKSFDRSRDLEVFQANGDHTVKQLEGLHFSWAANHAETTQEEETLGVDYFFEPDDVSFEALDPTSSDFPGPPTPLEALGAGRFAATNDILLSQNEISEDQDFFRADAEYEHRFTDALTLKLSSGGWYEKAQRGVDSTSLQTPNVNAISCGTSPNCVGSLQQFVILGDTPAEMAANIEAELNKDVDGRFSGLADTTNDSEREVQAIAGSLKATLWEKVDVLGGMRFESILIESNNDAFIGERRFGAEELFPTRYLFFDRLDNPNSRVDPVTGVPFREVCRIEPGVFVCLGPEEGTRFNDEILGISVPSNPETGFIDVTDEQIGELVNGKIDEKRYLPAVGIAYRPLEGLALRGAYSQTVARPSFREMGYYVSVDPSTDDLVVGNPQLQLSDVDSYDFRAEYTWGELGDLVAFSAFYKEIQKPIESIVVRNPLNFEVAGANFRTFFNNPSEATLWGIEAEARKHLGLFGWEFGEYISIGGNFTYIHAQVDRTEAELARSQAFFGVKEGDVAIHDSLDETRRLFGQPEWIANADISFDQPDWGTRITLAFFAISDLLDAAGAANIGPDGSVLAFTLDRYVDSYHTLDLILSQTFSFDVPLPGEWSLPSEITFKASLKNLTDSTRRILYDPYVTEEKIEERSYKIGRDYSFSVNYTIRF